MNTPEPSYYAIIPANVRYDTDLTPNAKLLYGEITSLCNQKGYCYATNDYFAALYGVSKTSISKWISSLVSKGYIAHKTNYKEGTKQILSRYLTLVTYPIEEMLNRSGSKVKEPIEEKLNTPIEDKLKDNIKDYNNKINNKQEYNSDTTDVVSVVSKTELKAEKKKQLFALAMDAYYVWYEEKNGIKPKIDGAGANALKQTIAYLKTVARSKMDPADLGDEEKINARVVESIEYIFSHWDLVRPFYREQHNLTQINANINNIMADIKKAPMQDRQQSVKNSFIYFKDYYNAR